jgi:hypothetical protein
MTVRVSEYQRLCVEVVDSAWMKPIASAADQASIGRFEAARKKWERERARVVIEGLSRDEIVKFAQATDRPDDLRTLVMVALAKPAQPQMEEA